MRHLLTYCILPALLSLSWGGAALGAAEVPVQRVEVRNQGNGPLDPASVRAYIRMKAGDAYSPRVVSGDLKRLEDTGRFSYVSVSLEQAAKSVIVIYTVEPRLKIRSLRIEGGEAFSNRRIRELLDLGVGGLVDDALLRLQLRQVEEEYHKRYFPDPKFTFDIEPYEASGSATVRIQVDEGPRAKVRKIFFEGNTALSDRQLRKVMTQKKTGLLSFLTGKGTLERDELDRDLLILRERYRQEGYLDAEILEPIVERRGTSRVIVTIPVVEHRKYSIRSVRVEGAHLFPATLLIRESGLREGQTASSLALGRARQQVQDYYGSRGYIDSRVRPRLNLDDEAPLIDVNFEVAEGGKFYVRDIGFRGNTRTHDIVLRRELTLYPGDVFNQVKVRKGANRLRNTGFFSLVNPTMVDTPQADTFDLVYDVEEQTTGQFIAGAGFSSVDDLIGFVELSQGNFDIAGWPSPTGAGQKVKLRVQAGTSRRDVELSFVEPWFLNRKLALGLDAFQHDRRFLSDDYDQRNTGGSIGLRKALNSFWRGRIGYSLQEIDVYDVSTNASAVIQQEEGARMQSSVSLSFDRDSRNKIFIPTKGSRLTLGGKVAGGPLGFDTDLYQLELRNSKYFPVWLDHVLSLRGWYQVVEEYGDSDRVPIFDRMFLGGARTIRGFDFREVGPVDEDGEPIGGRSSVFASAEYSIPLAQQFRFALFYDWGNVWEEAYKLDPNDYNSSYGLGFRIDFPGFPLRLDYSWQDKASEDNERSSGRFSFLIGYNL